MKRPELLLPGLLVMALLAAVVDLAGQSANIGIPPIRNFTRKAYRAGTQNWDAAQDARGVLYWANNEGLLEFDGVAWHCYPVRNGTIVRSLWIAPDGRIFVGAQSEIGYFYPDASGRLVYHSLTGLLPPAQRNFEDVWDIVPHPSGLFFRTNHRVFRYHRATIDAFESEVALQFMGRVGDALVVQQGFRTLLKFSGSDFEPWQNLPELAGPITGMLDYSADTTLVTTLKNGLFWLVQGQLSACVTPHDRFLTEHRVYCAALLPGGRLALGTSSGGLVLLDRQRRLVGRLEKKSGLQNNNMLSVYADRDENLWLGLDTGIDFVGVGSPFTTVFPDGTLEGTGYTAAIHAGRLYFGTANGLYSAPWSVYYDPLNSNVFEKVTSTDGQIWSLTPIGNSLLLGHHEGAFSVKGQAARRISPTGGAWTFVPISPDLLLGGGYEGLSLYRAGAGQWNLQKKLNGFDESARIMVGDVEGQVWVSHPYRGVYRIRPKPDYSAVAVEFFNSAQGLPSDLNNYVFNIRGRAVVGTERGVYRYDDSAGRFQPDTSFQRALGRDRRIKYLREDPEGHIWYLAGDEVGRLEVDDLGLAKRWRKETFPELTGRLVGGFEFIYPYDRYNVFFGAEKGFVHFNPAQARKSGRSATALLRRVSLTGDRDSILFGGWYVVKDSLSTRQPADAQPELAARRNSLRFSFSASAGADPATTEYRCFLKGLESGWSAWGPETERNYTNLGPGEYVFQVQARGADAVESPAATFTFRVLPPWYASRMAFGAYFLALCGGIALVIRRQKRHYESEKAKLHSAHRHTVARTEAELASLRHEKLEAEIAFKNQELATATMHLVQKGEILLKMQEAMHTLLEKTSQPAARKEVEHLLHLLETDTRLDQDWEQFAYHFDQVHVDFLQRLRERYPGLSPNDHRLCAYLRMNLSTKEIAPLMNISVRGVEASRYRLRKKLGLPNDANLTEVMLTL